MKSYENYFDEGKQSTLDTWRSRDLRSAECASLTTRLPHKSLLQSVTGVWELSKKVNVFWKGRSSCFYNIAKKPMLNEQAVIIQ